MTEIVSSRIRHQLQFSPNPLNPSFATTPIFVETRLIRDILEYPDRVARVHFSDVVENIVRMPDGKLETFYTTQFNEEIFFVNWDHKEHAMDAYLSSRSGERIEIHPDLRGKVWVSASSHRQIAEQNETLPTKQYRNPSLVDRHMTP